MYTKSIIIAFHCWTKASLVAQWVEHYGIAQWVEHYGKAEWIEHYGIVC